MINIYEGIFKLTNAKLYQSPYKANIDEIWNVLKNYNFRCQLNFLNNLTTLKLKNVDIEEIKKESEIATAYYVMKDNAIYLPTNSNLVMKDIINHELAHVASSKRDIDSGITTNGIGEHLNEGITEYINLKSQNKKVSTQGYQRELFVIEFLTHIYGEKILEPYFTNNSDKFFTQFDDFSNDIIDIDYLLKQSANHYLWQMTRLKYLFLTSIIPDILKADEQTLKELELNEESARTINNWLRNVPEQAISKIEVDKRNDPTNIINHIYPEENKQTMKHYYIEDYFQKQAETFEQILEKLIKIAQAQGLTPDDINTFLKTSLFYKDASFKQAYTNVIEEHFVSPTKKR